MGISVAQYEETPALTVDWDLELSKVEARAKAAVERKAQG